MSSGPPVVRKMSFVTETEGCGCANTPRSVPEGGLTARLETWTSTDPKPLCAWSAAVSLTSINPAPNAWNPAKSNTMPLMIGVPFNERTSYVKLVRCV